MKADTESDKVLLAHIGECIARVREYTASGRCAFFQSRMAQDAVLRNLQTLAESTQRLSDEIKEGEPDIPWRSISGFRNVLVHGYLGIDIEAVWGVVEEDLPALSDAVGRMARHDR